MLVFKGDTLSSLFPVTSPSFSFFDKHLLFSYSCYSVDWMACLTSTDHSFPTCPCSLFFSRGSSLDASSVCVSFSHWQELIPLILCTACLHPEPKERDQLLHILFNLIKRPDDEQRYVQLYVCKYDDTHVFNNSTNLPTSGDKTVRQLINVYSCMCVCFQRQMILTGCVAFARHVGPTRVEAELLPQCWEQVQYIHCR